MIQMFETQDTLGPCKFIVVRPDEYRLKTICPVQYAPIKGDVLTHRQDQITFWTGDFVSKVLYYRFDSSYYLLNNLKPFNFYYSDKELLYLQRDGIIILFKQSIQG